MLCVGEVDRFGFAKSGYMSLSLYVYFSGRLIDWSMIRELCVMKNKGYGSYKHLMALEEHFWKIEAVSYVVYN